MIQPAEQPVDYKTPPSADGTQRLHNFSAGPGALPLEVLEEVRNELPVYGKAGASVMEISHRSPEYDAIQESATAIVKRLLGLGSGWHVLYLQGGASMQFYQVPLNFLPREGSADYLITGAWAKKAYEEAKPLGNPTVAASSKDRNFCYIPKPETWQLNDGAAYLHYTSNNTIFGTQFTSEPDVKVPLVCDASSDFLSRRIQPERYGLIYAGAQKNLGPAGVTLVLAQDEFLKRRNTGLPTMLDYGTHIEDLFNTPPVFAVYMVEKVLSWLERLGGLEAMERKNEEKGGLLYGRIDRTDFYTGTADVDSRSLMNVCFRLQSEDLEKRFLSGAKANGLLALKGHRSVGGVRASIYNACPLESVEVLVSFMDEFERANG